MKTTTAKANKKTFSQKKKKTRASVPKIPSVSILSYSTNGITVEMNPQNSKSSN
ncbi:hypothetical protein [Leptospira sanjuanensis]|uniref:hypothetical protein n=1 Tax=Leptospira sanjuanensis TaxID=2879643 RepID=UPI001EE84A04|nr:hypothetical protein [Leptospira sanjuanensis]MCG6166393.1 hypothetical protein [Leptospira sanjuanensis]